VTRLDSKRQAADTGAFDAAKAARAARFGVPLKPTVKADDTVKAKGDKGGRGGKGGGGKAAAPVRCPWLRRPGCPPDPAAHPTRPPLASPAGGSLS